MDSYYKNREYFQELQDTNITYIGVGTLSNVKFAMVRGSKARITNGTGKIVAVELPVS